MKVVAILLLLAVAAFAHPQNGGEPEDAGAKIFMSLVKLCMHLEDAGSDDKRSWDAVLGLFGNVCKGIKNALGDDVNKLVPAERSLEAVTGGPSPTGDTPSRDGDRRPPPQRKGGKNEQAERSGPSPTADYPSRDGDRRPKKGSHEERSVDEPASPEEQLLKLCFALAELGEQMDNGQGKRGVAELEEALKGMEQVCLAAFVEAHAAA